jgi:hypothetical protein
MTEKTSDRVMGHGWRLFGVAFMLILTYFVAWGYTFMRNYAGLIHPHVKDLLPQLPEPVYNATFVLFWIGMFLIPIAITIILLSAIFELRINYAIYRAAIAELKKTSS